MDESPATCDSLTKRADAAFLQAAAKVITLAKQTGTPVILWENGHVKEIDPNDIVLPQKPNSPQTP